MLILSKAISMKIHFLIKIQHNLYQWTNSDFSCIYAYKSIFYMQNCIQNDDQLVSKHDKNPVSRNLATVLLQNATNPFFSAIIFFYHLQKGLYICDRSYHFSAKTGSRSPVDIILKIISNIIFRAGN